VRVVLYGNLRGRAGWSSRDFILNENTRLTDLLEQLKRESEELKEAISDVIILVNGRPVSQRELEQIMLKDGDVVEILPSVTGG